MRSAGKYFQVVSLDADPQATRLLLQTNSTFLAQRGERERREGGREGGEKRGRKAVRGRERKREGTKNRFVCFLLNRKPLPN